MEELSPLQILVFTVRKFALFLDAPAVLSSTLLNASYVLQMMIM